jgi:hypothetical protein
MASIMCGQKLWRALLVPGPRRTKRAAPVVEQPVFQNVIFGPWAATLARFDGHDLVVALDAAAFLTVVFRLGPRERFRFDFAKALGAALEDLGAPSRTVTLETSVIEFTPLVRLADQTLSRTLDDTKFFCDIELGYHEDLRRVQWNLNQLPHAGRDPCIPAEAVAALVGRSATDWNPPNH